MNLKLQPVVYGMCLLRRHLAIGIIAQHPLLFHIPKRKFQMVCRRTIITSSNLNHMLDARDKDHQKKQKDLVVRHGKQYFDETAEKQKNKATYLAALTRYLNQQATYRRGHVEFIYAAMDHLQEYGVNRDLEAYKKLFTLFPPKILVSRTAWQVEMMHYPKQQQCGIDILEHMEENGVIPDDDMGYKLIKIFGEESYVFRRYRRMMYWMPKFKYINPYYVPQDLPKDDIELAKMVLKRMSVDLENKISVCQTSKLESASDDTYIVSGQSPEQQALLAAHSEEESIFVEGAYSVWLRSKSFLYFVLRSEPTKRYQTYAVDRVEEDRDDTKFHWNFWQEEEQHGMVPMPTVHEQEDGTILATCITGTSSKDSLASWIKFLEKSNPKLSSIPVVFLLKSRGSEIMTHTESADSREMSNSYKSH